MVDEPRHPYHESAQHNIKEEEFASACRRHGLALAYLFGSQAENGVRILSGESVELTDPLTDIDLGVVTLLPLPGAAERLALYASLYDDLADFFAPYPLDLVFLEENHSVMQAQALRGTCVYASSPSRRDAYEMMILRRAADFKPVLDRFHQESLEEL